MRQNEDKALRAFMLAKDGGKRLGKLERLGRDILQERRNAIDAMRGIEAKHSDTVMFYSNLGSNTRAAMKRDKTGIAERVTVEGSRNLPSIKLRRDKAGIVLKRARPDPVEVNQAAIDRAQLSINKRKAIRAENPVVSLAIAKQVLKAKKDMGNL